MARDRRRFQDAYYKRMEMLEAGSIGAPVAEGIAVILCSYYSDWGDDEKAETHAREDIRTFRKEAYSLVSLLGRLGTVAEVILDATKADIDYILGDPSVASIYTIGLGNLSSLLLPGAYNDIYDWTDVADAADHLKTGFFVQRHCGNLVREFNPPLGMFAVADLRNVIAPVGYSFEPSDLYDSVNDLLIPVFESETTSYREIKNDLPKNGAD